MQENLWMESNISDHKQIRKTILSSNYNVNKKTKQFPQDVLIKFLSLFRSHKI